MRIGILGGTFNPIHLGHLILAEEIREKLKLNRVIFVPTYLPPHKTGRGIAPAKDRLAMLRRAIRGNRYFSVSDIEIRRKGHSYTIDTLYAFKKNMPQEELFFITGSDLLRYLRGWKDLKQIIKIVKFVVATRPGYPLEKIPAYIKTVKIRPVDISGIEIRRAVRNGRSVRYLVSDSVAAYIKRNSLYK